MQLLVVSEALADGVETTYSFLPGSHFEESKFRSLLLLQVLIYYLSIVSVPLS